MEFNVAFTGYRPEKMPFIESEANPQYTAFRAAHRGLVEHLIKQDCVNFFCGMARGFDLWAAEDVLYWRRTYPHIRLLCALPFPGQASSWSDSERARWERVLAAADGSHTVCPAYHKGCFHERNRYMVDRSDVLVAAFDGKPGGTAYTVDYARELGLAILQINPATAEIIRI